MACNFCYVPFDGREESEQTARRVIDRIAQWEVRNITFGGGDPLMYPYFCNLLGYTRMKLGKDTLVQVDTNGLQLHSAHIDEFAKSVDIVGLPLETTSKYVAGAMRRYPKHPAIVLGLLENLTRRNIAVKINTVVTRENLEGLISLGKALSPYRVQLWSLYQFWPIGPSDASDCADKIVEDQEFLDAVDRLRRIYPEMQMEIGLVAERSPGYFFVTQTGRSYTVASGVTDQYAELGSIFDNSVTNNWLRHSNPTMNAERAYSRERLVRAAKS